MKKASFIPVFCLIIVLFGASTAQAQNPLIFPNTIGRKISFWNSGPNNEYGIGLNYGIMQLYTAGQDKIAMGYGNSANFKETIRFMTGPGQIGFQNTLGGKISFWNSGPDNDFGIGISTGVMQLYTAGKDKIAFGYGNSTNFVETMSFLTGTGQLGLGTKTPTAKLTLVSTQTGAADNTMTIANFSIGPNTSHVHWGLSGDWYIRSAAANGKVILQDKGGEVGIGTTNTAGYKLAVNGKVRATEIRVETGWADYVFAPEYKLRPLEEVESFIKANQHLPEIQPASEIQANGLDVAATTTKMMAKIEELTLYLIEMNKENDALKQRVNTLENKQ